VWCWVVLVVMCMLHCDVYAALWCVCCTVMCYAALWCVCCTVMCYAVLCDDVMCCTELCCSVISCAVISCTVLCCTALQCLHCHCSGVPPDECESLCEQHADRQTAPGLQGSVEVSGRRGLVL
jgi:hypothetical protein